ncbi:MAG: hypothetical protein JJT95_06065 [Pararhodobacter sp.]|nr:hypothetical protein [Pararhodobacter sp.]
MKDEFKNSERGNVLDNATTDPKSTLTIDAEKYQAFLDGSDMTEAQKEEFLQALWSIIVSFVELGFGVHPLQEVCGKPTALGGEGAKDAFDGVCSNKSRTEEEDNGFKP